MCNSPRGPRCYASGALGVLELACGEHNGGEDPPLAAGAAHRGAAGGSIRGLRRRVEAAQQLGVLSFHLGDANGELARRSLARGVDLTRVKPYVKVPAVLSESARRGPRRAAR
jgi:hypothetical protein